MSVPRFPPGAAHLHLLAIGVDGFWKPWIEAAIGRDDSGIEFVPSPREALPRLMSGSRQFSHVLLNTRQTPSEAAQDIAALMSLTSGDAGSQTRLMLLGQSGPPPETDPRGACLSVVSDDAASLGDILRQDAARKTAAAPVTFGPGDLLCRIASDALEIRYQPMIRLADRRPMAYEALARLYHPEHGMLSADRFVPAAERSGLSPVLTQAIGGRMMRDLAVMPAAARLPTGLNFSLDVMLIDGTLDILEAQREAAGIAVEHIAIELTESRPAQDFPALRRALDRLRRAGYTIALDDVAPALPRLQELLDLPFTAVKLDKSVLNPTQPNQRAEAGLANLVEACKARDLLVVAEGAEQERDLERMREIGADWAQGFLIGRPLPAAALPIWRNAWPG